MAPNPPKSVQQRRARPAQQASIEVARGSDQRHPLMPLLPCNGPPPVQPTQHFGVPRQPQLGKATPCHPSCTILLPAPETALPMPAQNHSTGLLSSATLGKPLAAMAGELSKCLACQP
mmetsp:Transcript_59869/g.133496  ORF Transcript_59869/g.133496 Transcript_59869/m.133496 type:complete len:118 (-) Transcript_59869:158-511(-)